MFKISIHEFCIKNIPKLLFLYAIIFDNLNGLFQVKFQIESPIGFIYRGGMMLLLSFLTFNVKRNIFKIFFLILTCLYLFCIPIWSLSKNDFILSLEFDYLFKLMYFFLVVMFFYKYKNDINEILIINYIVNAGFLIALLNIFCLLTNTGNNSYGEDFGFGKKAFFVDGNSLAIYMVIVLSISIWYAFYSESIKKYMISFIITVGTIIIGSRVAVVGSIVVWISLLMFFLFFKDRYVFVSARSKSFITLFFVLLILGVIYCLVLLPNYFDVYTMNKFTIDSALSSRDSLIVGAKKIISNFSFSEMLIGKGFSGGIKSLGENYLGDSDLKLTEADIYDSILCFGWGLGLIVVLFNIFILFKIFIYPFFCYKSSLTFLFVMIGILWFAVSTMAGHGYFNTMLAPLFGSIYLITYKLKKYDSQKY